VATNSNALPMLSDGWYRRLFPQPAVGLTDLGRAAVESLCRHRVLVDLSHMTDRAVDDTLTLLDELDPARAIPVVASHAGYRFGGQEYNLREDAIRRIAERDGVIGLIFANHQILDGLDAKPAGFADSVDVLCRHIARLREITGSNRHVAIGSDLDGFIKPTLEGLDNAADLARLEAWIREDFPDAAEGILHANADGVIRRVFELRES